MVARLNMVLAMVQEYSIYSIDTVREPVLLKRFSIDTEFELI